MKNKILIALLFFLWGGASLKAQVQSAQQRGTLGLNVLPSCHVIVENPRQPIHFSPNENNGRHLKHVRIISNHAWQLLVQAQTKYLENGHGDKLDMLRIGYSFQNITGDGSFTSPEAAYQLFRTPSKPPYGSGNVAFDVLFDLDISGLINVKWGNYNTKVDFICIPYAFE